MIRTNKLLIIVGVIVAVMFSVFVWPTLYRYDHLNVAGSVIPARINRLSGSTDILNTYGWQHIKDNTKNEYNILKNNELSKLAQQSANLESGYIRAGIYNGTDKIITEITIEIILSTQIGGRTIDNLFDVGNQSNTIKWQVEWTRKYMLRGSCEPLSSSEFNAKVGFEPNYQQKWTWNIVGAKYY
jgi:hypothetical protein